MKIHEYQARSLFTKYGIPVPEFTICEKAEEVEAQCTHIQLPVVVKAQVHQGGRGKAGGVKFAENLADAKTRAEQILGMNIKGSIVEKVMVTHAIDIAHEYYLGLINDRAAETITIIASKEGGVEIEEVAETNPEKIITYPINVQVGLMPYEAREIAYQLSDKREVAGQIASILLKLYQCYIGTDSSLAEINPLVLDDKGIVWAIDGKMNFDENALGRQPAIVEMREPDEEEQLELDAKEKGLSYIALDGDIGCMVNGAGLAMATMDIIKLFGGDPANFLDIGGSSNPEKVVEAMKILTSDKKVKVIMINIFGGITRCDDVAKGLLTAMEKINVDLPIVARLAGTNAEEGKKILEGTNLHAATSLPEAAQLAIQLVK